MVINTNQAVYQQLGIYGENRTTEKFVDTVAFNSRYGLNETQLKLINSNKDEYRSKFIQQINEMIEIIESYNYPWDFFASTQERGHFGIVYYAGDTIIKSEDGSEMPIFDMYIALVLKFGETNDLSKISIRGITFSRSSFTKAEFYCQYQHSHISSANMISRTTNENYDCNIDVDDLEYDEAYLYIRPCFDYFCLGNTEIQTNEQELAIKGYNKLQFELLINQIQSFLSWESISGVPYINMSSVINTFFDNDENNNHSTIKFLSMDELVNISMTYAIAKRNIFNRNDFLISNDDIILKYNNLVYNKLQEFIKENKYSFNTRINQLKVDGKPLKVPIEGHNNDIDVSDDEHDEDDIFNTDYEMINLFIFQGKYVPLCVVNNVYPKFSTEDEEYILSVEDFQEFYKLYNEKLNIKYANFKAQLIR